jgi:hypothetical protein
MRAIGSGVGANAVSSERQKTVIPPRSNASLKLGRRVGHPKVPGEVAGEGGYMASLSRTKTR